MLAERLRFWTSEHVVAPLLARMADVSRAVAARQQQLGLPFVVAPLVPDPTSGWANLQLPDAEPLQQAVARARQELKRLQAAAAAPATGGGGLFGKPVAAAPQPQEQAQLREISTAVKVRAGSGATCVCGQAEHRAQTPCTLRCRSCRTSATSARSCAAISRTRVSWATARRDTSRRASRRLRQTPHAARLTGSVAAAGSAAPGPPTCPPTRTSCSTSSVPSWRRRSGRLGCALRLANTH